MTAATFEADPQADADLSKRVRAGLAAAGRGAGLDGTVRETVVGDGRRAFELLVVRHDRLALMWAGRYRSRLHRAGMTDDEIDAIARGGLAHGLARYDPGRGYTVATYVSWHVRRVLSSTLHSGYDRSVRTPAWEPLYGQADPVPVRRGRAVRTVPLDDDRGGTARSLADTVADPCPGPAATVESGLASAAFAGDLRDLLGSDPALRDAALALAGLDGLDGASGLADRRAADRLAHPAITGALLRRARRGA